MQCHGHHGKKLSQRKNFWRTTVNLADLGSCWQCYPFEYMGFMKDKVKTRASCHAPSLNNPTATSSLVWEFSTTLWFGKLFPPVASWSTIMKTPKCGSGRNGTGGRSRSTSIWYKHSRVGYQLGRQPLFRPTKHFQLLPTTNTSPWDMKRCLHSGIFQLVSACHLCFKCSPCFPLLPRITQGNTLHFSMMPFTSRPVPQIHAKISRQLLYPSSRAPASDVCLVLVCTYKEWRIGDFLTCAILN